MRFEKMPPAELRLNDGAAMIEAITQLRQADVDVRRPPGNPHQLKVRSDLSYYPATGRIVQDGAPTSFEVRGIEALLRLLGVHTEPAGIERSPS